MQVERMLTCNQVPLCCCHLFCQGPYLRHGPASCALNHQPISVVSGQMFLASTVTRCISSSPRLESILTVSVSIAWIPLSHASKHLLRFWVFYHRGTLDALSHWSFIKDSCVALGACSNQAVNLEKIATIHHIVGLARHTHPAKTPLAEACRSVTNSVRRPGRLLRRSYGLLSRYVIAVKGLASCCHPCHPPNMEKDQPQNEIHISNKNSHKLSKPN
jgi:hypothetical protein